MNAIKRLLPVNIKALYKSKTIKVNRKEINKTDIFQKENALRLKLQKIPKVLFIHSSLESHYWSSVPR